MSRKTVAHRHPKLLNYLPNVFYTLVVAEDCTVKSVSQHSLPWLGYAPEELVFGDSHAVKRLVHPDDQETVLKMRKQSLGSESLTTMEYRLMTKSGNILHVVDQWISYRSPDDDSWIMEGQLSETNEGGIKSRLIHQLKAYRDAVDVNLISSITDAAGKIIYANENFCRISKYSVTELIGQNHRIVHSGHHPRSFFVDLWKTISRGELWQGEILNRAKDGSLYWVSTVIIPIFDDQKKIEKYLSLRMLITDRKRLEEERSRYTLSLEKIAFMVAHDIRGPLCSILGLVHILVKHAMSPQETRTALEHLDDASQRLHEITKRLSQFVFENEIELRARLFVDKIGEDQGYINKKN